MWRTSARQIFGHVLCDKCAARKERNRIFPHSHLASYDIQSESLGEHPSLPMCVCARGCLAFCLFFTVHLLSMHAHRWECLRHGLVRTWIPMFPIRRWTKWRRDPPRPTVRTRVCARVRIRCKNPSSVAKWRTPVQSLPWARTFFLPNDVCDHKCDLEKALSCTASAKLQDNFFFLVCIRRTQLWRLHFNALANGPCDPQIPVVVLATEELWGQCDVTQSLFRRFAATQCETRRLPARRQHLKKKKGEKKEKNPPNEVGRCYPRKRHLILEVRLLDLLAQNVSE